MTKLCGIYSQDGHRFDQRISDIKKGISNLIPTGGKILKSALTNQYCSMNTESVHVSF